VSEDELFDATSQRRITTTRQIEVTAAVGRRKEQGVCEDQLFLWCRIVHRIVGWGALFLDEPCNSIDARDDAPKPQKPSPAEDLNRRVRGCRFRPVIASDRAIASKAQKRVGEALAGTFSRPTQSMGRA
jgi:hypothetical protein